MSQSNIDTSTDICNAVTWRDPVDELPDDEMIVLVAVAGDAGDPVWLGYHTDGGWRTPDHEPIEVTHWAELPEVPAKYGAKA